MTRSCEVSVIIPAYNSAATLPQAVHSVMQQDLQDFELLIVDDGSTDATSEVARQFSDDSRVTFIPLPENRGKPHAMNLGIRMAHGRWIAVLDADDWYAPSRLSTLLATGECANVQLVADNQFVYDEGAAQVVRTALRATTGHKRLDKPEFVAGCDPYAEFDLGMLKPVVRTEFVHKANLNYRESARLSEDFLYLLEFFAAGGEGCLISRPLYYWRQAFGSLSRHWTASGHGAWRYDFLSGARASEDVLKALRQGGDRELARMLQRRIRAFHRLHRLQEVNRKRADGAPLRDVAATVAMHPSIWSLIAQRLLRRFNASRDHESLSGVH